MFHLPLLQSRVIKHHTSSLTYTAPDTKLRTNGRYRIRTTATLCRLMALNHPCTVRIAATVFKCSTSVSTWTRQLGFTGWWWWWRWCMARWCTSWWDGWSPGPRAAHGYYFYCIQKESQERGWRVSYNCNTFCETLRSFTRGHFWQLLKPGSLLYLCKLSTQKIVFMLVIHFKCKLRVGITYHCICKPIFRLLASA